MDTSTSYQRFADIEVRGKSPTWAMICSGIAADGDVIARVDALPAPKRQPNLLLAAARYLGLPIEDYPSFRRVLLDRWDEVRAVMSARSTQTNEAGRCAVLLPLLAGLPGPLALIEVGASAGLCLQPDRYRYRYDDGVVLGDAGPILDCATAGPVPLPSRRPEVVWRAGLDLCPLDVTDADDVRWLESLIWPGQPHRLDRLRSAIEVTRADPPTLVRGDLTTDLDALIATAPVDATVVVFHSAVLCYLPVDGRDAFVSTMTGHPRVRWISNEAPGVFPAVDARVPVVDHPGGFTIALDGEPVAAADPHGAWLRWFER
ncbi:DUF2332 domain-containing protein [Stackebrandtia soli]|uniref:DUF2332 domain-containing protein n=1 Tax=Stackebrandtia soli TaxID=1892856 RepID=UPI0039E8AAE0